MRFRSLTGLLLAILSACVPASSEKSMSAYSADMFAAASARDFIRAVLAGDAVQAVALARLAPDGVNTLGASGETALLIAVDRGDIRMVEALLKAGARPDGGPDRSPLHPATRARDGRMLEMLLKAGANPNLAFDGESPLYEAALIGNVPAASMLIRHGARPELGNSIGNTPAITAAAADHWEMVRFLLQNGASIWTVPQHGSSVATFAEDSRVRRDTPNGQALEEVVAHIRASGYPWPPPAPPALRKMIEAGQWPPRPAGATGAPGGRQ